MSFIRRNEGNINVINRKGNLTNDKIQKLEDANKILQEKVNKLVDAHKQMTGVWYTQQNELDDSALKFSLKRMATMDVRTSHMKDMVDDECILYYLNF